MLLERNAQVIALGQTLVDGVAGNVSVALIEGAVGCGKTVLLEDATSKAVDAGFAVLQIVGGVRPAWLNIDGDRRRIAITPEIPSEVQRILDGRRLAISLDDGHALADEDSSVIQRTVEAVRQNGVVLLVARGPLHDPHRTRLDSFLLRQPTLRRITVGGLSFEGAARLISGQVGDRPVTAVQAEEFHAATGGNPLLLRALAQECPAAVGEGVVRARVRPALRGLFVQSALSCLHRSSPELVDAAAGLAVMGAEATVDLLGDLLGVAPAVAQGCVDALGAMGIVRDCRFRHPVVEAAVLDFIPRERRMALHRQSAALLQRRAGDPVTIARHLSAAQWFDESWGIGVLRDAAHLAVARDDPHEAIRMLDLVARATTDERRRAAVLASIAIVTARLDPPAAERLLPPAKAAGPREAARAAECPPVPGLVESDAEGWWERLLRGSQPPRLGTRVRLGGGSPNGRHPALQQTALLWLEPSTGLEKASVAEHRLRVSPLTDATVPELVNLIRELAFADRAEAALGFARKFTEEAAGRDAPGWEAMFGAAAAEVTLGQGAFLETVNFADRAMARVSLRTDSVFSLGLRASLILAYTAMGEFERAGKLVTPVPERLVTSIDSIGYLRARGYHLLATGRVDNALEYFTRIGETVVECGMDRPALIPWRLDAARARIRVGDLSGAGELIAVQRQSYEASNHRVRGITLRLQARLSDERHRVDLLRKAIGELRKSDDVYELAMAIADLGDTYLGVGDSAKATIARRRAWRFAKACNALALCEELLPGFDVDDAEMEHVRKVTLDRLSDSEQRVALLVGRGYPNREIADKLFVTVSTVEQHLTRVYRKLGIDGRQVLEQSIETFDQFPR